MLKLLFDGLAIHMMFDNQEYVCTVASTNKKAPSDQVRGAGLIIGQQN